MSMQQFRCWSQCIDMTPVTEVVSRVQGTQELPCILLPSLNHLRIHSHQPLVRAQGCCSHQPSAGRQPECYQFRVHSDQLLVRAQGCCSQQLTTGRETWCYHRCSHQLLTGLDLGHYPKSCLLK